MTIAVIGQTRSGTSLTMQMLAAAGLKVPGQYPAFEDDRVWRGRGADRWWREFDAIKIVDPHNGETIYRRDLFSSVVVCRRRDYQAQADSTIKMLGHGMGLPPLSRATVRRDIARQDRFYRKAAQGPGAMCLFFEDTLARPLEAARTLARHVCRRDSADDMAALVVERDPGCYPGFLEVLLAMREETP